MMTVVQVGDQLIFAGGGVPDFVFFNAVDLYNDKTKTWTSAKLSQNVYANILIGAVSGNKAFFTGGDKPNNVDMYNAQTGKWQTLTAPSSHQLNPVVSNGNKVFFAGGLNNTTGQVDMYDTETDSWTNLGKLSVKRYYAAGASVGRKVLFAGGINNSTAVDIYTLPPSGVSKGDDQPFECLVFPNPSQDWLYLRFNEVVSGTFSLLRPDGTLLSTQQIDNKQIIEVNTSHLPVGSYIWQCIDGKGVRIKSGIVTKVAH
jgi:N-acetylneuraminic acid mutarotase